MTENEPRAGTPKVNQSNHSSRKLDNKDDEKETKPNAGEDEAKATEGNLVSDEVMHNCTNLKWYYDQIFTP